MDTVRRKRWFTITVYVLSFFGVWSLLLFFAETYYPNQPTSLFRRQLNPQKTIAAQFAQQGKLFLQIDQKQSSGKTELIYRGLVGRSEFQIDVIIPELDPQVSYPYRFKISQAKKSLRLGNRNYQLIAAKKGALHLKLMNPQ